MTTFAQLPRRQREIAELYLRGLSVCQIALKLGRSRNTIATARRLVFKRLDIADRGALAARWAKEYLS